MGKEEQKWEQAEVEEQEEEETTLIVRKPRNVNGNKTTEIAAVDVEVGTNGVSEINGHTVEPKAAANGAQNEEPILGEEQKIEELDGVLENKSEAINGEQKIEELDGIVENKPEPKNGEQKIEELDGVLENEATNGEQKSENLVFYDKAEGVKSAFSYFGEKQIVKDPGHEIFDISSLDFTVKNSSTSAINNGYEGDLEKDRFPIYKSSQEIESAEVDLINEDDLEIKELDVERVIQKQTTHDLYCPNCNSCITKRVILRKRKRRVRISEEELKRCKIEADSKLVTGSVQSPSDLVHHTDEVGDNDTQLPTAEEDTHHRGPDAFRCLACFSIFIPTGNGFKLFRIFGDKSGKENVRDEQEPTMKKNWFTSMFGSNKQETTVEQGSSSRTDVPKGDVGVKIYQSGQPSVSHKPRSPAYASEGPVGTATNNDNLEGTEKVLTSPRQKPSLNGKLINGHGDKFDVTATTTADATMEQFHAYTNDELKDSKSITEVVNHDSDLSVTTLPKRTQVTNGESVEDAISFSQQGGLKLLISSNKGPQTPENSEEGQIANQTIQSGSTGQVYPTEASQHLITKTKFEVHSGELLKVDNISTVNGASVAQGKDTVITIDAQPAVSSPTVPAIIRPMETPSVSQSATQINIADRERAEARKEFQIEVIKSIVYGGLAESITSLSVVSSAAGGGAATLNILALGMANLIGGLFVICHNLWDLKCERVVEQVTTQVSDEATEQRDRYKELLGRRHNFIFHAVVAIISYLVFGLVPPIIYGFSFRKTDDKQLKLLVVAAASLLCIVVLAISRAHVRCPPKPYLKSVVTFVILGFMVSGVSYAAGELVERLLKELGVFKSGSVSNLLVPEMMMMTPAGAGSASY